MIYVSTDMNGGLNMCMRLWWILKCVKLIIREMLRALRTDIASRVSMQHFC